jgi:SAM-dependent methyltransferase
LFQVVRQGSALDRLSPVVATFAVSLVAWLPAMFLFSFAAAGLEVDISVSDSFRVFGVSTLGGGISLMPAGVGTMGGLAILQLEGIGLGLTEAVAVVSVVRLATVGLTLGVGVAFLLPQLLRLGRQAEADRSFDVIADEYLDQFSPHIWSLLLERKTAQIREALGPPPPNGLGLDLGCGLGFQAGALQACGYNVIGLDPAHKLLREAVGRGVPAFTGDALSLPVADESLDFVYTVGVLHHLPAYSAQDAARREVWRVLKPGGAFVVLETNPRNPLFRLYMSYLFPLLRSIDEGIELWLDDDRWANVPGFDLEPIRYFTFLPDFLPRWLLRAALPLEKALERSALGRFSVHYLAVLRKRV